MALPLILQALAGGLLGQYGANKLNEWQSSGTRSMLLGQPSQNVMDSMPPVGPPTATGQEAARENYMRQQPGTGLLSMFPPEAAPLLQGQSTGSLQSIAGALLNPQQPKQTALLQNLAAAGVDFNSPEGRKILLDAVMKPQVAVHNYPRPEPGMRLVDPNNPLGPVEPVEGGTKDPNSPLYSWTEGEMVAGGYANRMNRAETIMQSLVENGYNPADTGEHSRAAIPYIGNFLASKEYQQFRQAQEDWVRAKLRKESGAVIADEEMEREIRAYFPVPGDSQEVINQKARARQTATQGLIESSRGYYERRLKGQEPYMPTQVPKRREGETIQQWKDRTGQ